MVDSAYSSYHSRLVESSWSLLLIEPSFDSYLSAVVEMMAAGLVTLAHRSGGPLMDIVVEEESSRNGFLASHDQVRPLVLNGGGGGGGHRPTHCGIKVK